MPSQQPDRQTGPTTAPARFKDLCLDVDGPATAGFWAALLGRPLVPTGGEDSRIGTGAATVWVNHVPEARRGKTRVHLDVRVPATTALELGAALVRGPAGTQHWTVLADPEGNEFCTFEPREGSTPGPFEVVVDSADPLAQATWWAGVWGGTVGSHETEPWAWVSGAPGSPYDDWVFVAVPEPKMVKNRWHWDVTLAGAEVQPLLDRGATLVGERWHGGKRSWWVLADPEGNEFCAFPG